MMLIRTEIRSSTIHGIGCFALDEIQEGEIIWELTPDWDKVFKYDDIATLQPVQRSWIERYCWQNEQGDYVMCCDSGSYFNHSDSPNCGHNANGQTIALRPICRGEELTSNYKDLDASCSERGIYPGDESFM